jgi:hypothetical protein
MEKKQTAVQWLQDKLLELEIKIDYKAHQETFFLFEQAKQMEKEQIEESFNSSSYFIDGKEYYDDTYKQQDNGN